MITCGNAGPPGTAQRQRQRQLRRDGQLAGGRVAVGNSRDSDGPALVFTQPEWAAFVRGAVAGEFG